MRRILILLTCLFGMFICINATTQNEWDALIRAISYVESRNNDNVTSSNGKHFGRLQISMCVIEECNEIVGKKKYSKKDCYVKEKAIEMFNLIQNKYNKSHGIEAAIRLWNGGPSWNKKLKATNGYYKRVISRYQIELGK